MRILPLQKLLTLIVVMCASVLAFAQPANDDCSTPTLLVVGADAASCVPVAGDTRGTVDATAVDGPEVCSGSWYTDDVWFSFETGATAPQFGVTVEVRLDAANDTELLEQGMGIYLDCETTSMPIDCFSDEPGRRTITFPAQCLDPNSTYLIRLWSAPDAITNSGTFSICAYEAEDDGGNTGGEPAPRVIYQETFDKGLNGWSSVAETMSTDASTGELVADDWMWSNTGCVPSAFGGSECLTRAELACQEVGVVGIPAGWFQTQRTGDVGLVGAPPYPDVLSSLVSPSIDLSKESCVNLTWIESHRGLNGGTLSRFGPAVQYSIDGGENWINPSQAINSADVSINYGGTYVVNAGQNAVQRSIPLIGAEGNPDVRVRFVFDGDFYYWIVDDITIIEGTTADIVAQSNFFARAHINPMSIHQVDSYDFLIDIANLACEDQTNVNVNVTGVNSAGAEVHNVDLAYGSIESDSLAENQPFLQPFTPTADVDTYTFTYTASSDVDQDLSNNVRTFTASVVDETMFRKEDGVATGVIGPNTDAFFVEGDPFNWEMGNIFFAPNALTADGENKFVFNTISFQLDNAAEMIGERLNVWLYKITDNDFDGIINKDDASEISIVGISEYTVTGTENALITVDIESFGGSLDIEENSHYMAAIESNFGPGSAATLNAVAMNFADSDAYDYSAAIFNARNTANGDLNAIRYAHGFAITAEGYFRISPSTTGDLTTGNFPEDATPLIRLGYEIVPITSTVEINENVDIEIAPNPASTNITVDLSIKEATDMEVSIVNLTGQRIMTKSFNNVTELRENFDVSRLASGIYMIHIDTKNGVQTKKFVVSK